MKIVRSVCERVYNEYILEVSDNVIDELNEYVNGNMADPSKSVTLTISDIENIIKGRENGVDWSKYDEVYEFNSYWSEPGKVNTFNSTLGDYIWNYLDDCIWDCEPEFINSYTDDVETIIEEE